MSESIFQKYINNKIAYDEFENLVSTTSEDSDANNQIGLNQSELELYHRLGKEALDNILVAREQKAQIITKWKKFFREEIAENHRKNTIKLEHLKEFNLNPFLDTYKANFLLGDSSAKSKATALVYARSLGTSINTSFGTQLQRFCSDILSGFASTTSGIDIEFEDFTDGRRKYCQIKAGPNTINKDDVKTITDHFSDIKNLARTNHLNIALNDLTIGVFYGEEKELSGHYKKLKNNFPVYIGQDFWYRLTGDRNFYHELTAAINEVAAEYDGRVLINKVIEKLAIEIEKAED